MKESTSSPPLQGPPAKGRRLLSARASAFFVLIGLISSLFKTPWQNFRHLAPVQSVSDAPPVDNIDAFSIKRPDFDSMFVEGSSHQELKADADADGPILDFAVVGMPKCGTTTMIANLGHVAPVNGGDICTPVPNTVWYAYKNWPKEYGPDKKMRGVKCPMFLDAPGYPVRDFSRFLPRTGLIVGIRHPVLWFQSFYNMQVRNNRRFPAPYELAVPPCLRGARCGRGGCPRPLLFCVNRAKFHLALARLGKTPLDEAERGLLPPEVENLGVRNRVFLYETGQMSDGNRTRQERFWDDIARFIGYPGKIRHDKYSKAGGRGHATSDSMMIDICDAEYDALRSMLMPFAWQMSKWVCGYFVRKGRDVFVSSEEHLCGIIEKYSADPCGRLVRLSNGTYVLDAERIAANRTASAHRTRLSFNRTGR